MNSIWSERLIAFSIGLAAILVPVAMAVWGY